MPCLSSFYLKISHDPTLGGQCVCVPYLWATIRSSVIKTQHIILLKALRVNSREHDRVLAARERKLNIAMKAEKHMNISSWAPKL